MIRAIIFDLDGTIIDSEPLALEAVLECSSGWNVPVTRDDAAFVAGKKWEVAFDLLFSRYQFPLSRKEAAEQIMGRYEKLLQAGIRTVPGVVEAIHALSLEYALALVSGSNRKDVLWALESLQVKNKFTTILGAEDYPNSKPAPDGFLKALGILKAGPKETLVFEDSFAGIASGLAAGLRVAAIESTNHFNHDQSAAHVRIPDFTGIDPNWVKKSFS